MKGLLAAHTGSDQIPSPTDANARLAVWQTWLGGTRLARHPCRRRRRAAATHRGGYPNTYLIPFARLQTQLEGGLLDPGKPWRSAAGDTFLPNYLGRDTAFEEVVASTDPGEWIVIQAWDES